MTPTVTPASAAFWFVGFAAASVWTWYSAEAARRDDWWDRRKLGRLWMLFDRDARRVAGRYLSAAALAVAAVAGPVVMYPYAAVPAVAAVASVIVWWKRRTRTPARTPARTPSPNGTSSIWYVYALAGFDKTTGDARGIKIGWTGRTPDIRCSEIDEREQTLNVRVLAYEEHPTEADAKTRESSLHATCDRWRMSRSEWFEASPEVLQVASAMPHRTAVGEQFLQAAA